MKFNVKSENLEGSKVKLTVTVVTSEFDSTRKQAEKNILKDVEIKGFRKGNVPLDLFVKTYGEMPIAMEQAQLCIEKTYVEAITSSKISAIGTPNVDIIEIADPKKDFTYTITVDVLPEVKLGSYKKLHKDVKEEEVKDTTDSEVDDVLKEMLSYQKKDGEAEPELNEEMIKKMGFDSGKKEDLVAKIKENLKTEKEFKAKEVRRGKILEAVIEGTEADIPDSLAQNQLLKIKERIEGDLAQMGVSFVDYLKHLSKTEEEWKKGEFENAKKAVKLELALMEIAKKENVYPSKEAVEAEVAHLKLHYPQVDEERLRAYSMEKMTNSFVAEYVVTGKTPDEKEFFKVDHAH